MKHITVDRRPPPHASWILIFAFAMSITGQTHGQVPVQDAHRAADVQVDLIVDLWPTRDSADAVSARKLASDTATAGRPGDKIRVLVSSEHAGSFLPMFENTRQLGDPRLSIQDDWDKAMPSRFGDRRGDPVSVAEAILRDAAQDAYVLAIFLSRKLNKHDIGRLRALSIEIRARANSLLVVVAPMNQCAELSSVAAFGGRVEAIGDSSPAAWFEAVRPAPPPSAPPIPAAPQVVIVNAPAPIVDPRIDVLLRDSAQTKRDAEILKQQLSNANSRLDDAEDQAEAAQRDAADARRDTAEARHNAQRAEEAARRAADNSTPPRSPMPVTLRVGPLGPFLLKIPPMPLAPALASPATTTSTHSSPTVAAAPPAESPVSNATRLPAAAPATNAPARAASEQPAWAPASAIQPTSSQAAAASGDDNLNTPVPVELASTDPLRDDAPPRSEVADQVVRDATPDDQKSRFPAIIWVGGLTVLTLGSGACLAMILVRRRWAAPHHHALSLLDGATGEFTVELGPRDCFTLESRETLKRDAAGGASHISVRAGTAILSVGTDDVQVNNSIPATSTLKLCAGDHLTLGDDENRRLDLIYGGIRRVPATSNGSGDATATRGVMPERESAPLSRKDLSHA